MIKLVTPDFTLDQVDLTYRQHKFVEYLESAFNIRTAKGDEIPYKIQPFQAYFHSECILAKPEAKDRLINKARGIGATMMLTMEYIVMMRRYNDITIPITSTTDDAAKKLIEWAYWLARHANLDFGVVSDNKYELVLDNGSQMVAIPGGNPKRFRNIRAPAIGFDEFAHCEYQSDILTAARRCMSEGGQASIVSTPIGASNLFWQIRDNGDEFNYTVFEMPIFDPQKFDVNTPIPVQVDAGLNKLAPWIDIGKMEDDRRFDPIAFMQENMCSPQDESVAFLPVNLIKDCVDEELFSHDYMKSANPCIAGFDFAYKRNLSALIVLEVAVIDGKKTYIMRHLQVIAGADTPVQVDIIAGLMEKFPITSISVDSTGPGIGLYHDLRKIYKYKVKGINFSRKIDLSGERTTLKRAMALKMKRLMVENQVKLINDSALLRDLNSVPYQSLNAPKSSDLGHGDRFWGLALALWNDMGRATIKVGKPLTFGKEYTEKFMPKPLLMGVNQKW